MPTKNAPKDAPQEAPQEGQEAPQEGQEAPPTGASQEAAPQEAPDPYEGLSDEGHNEFAAGLIDQAVALQDEKKALLTRIDNNRQTLRLVVGSGLVSPKQAKFVEITYPPRKGKNSSDDQAAA